MKKRIVKFLDISLKYGLIAILLLDALMFFFVFMINWEDWFFGTKLAGMPAGLYLLIKGLSAAALVFLIMKYPRYIQQLVIVTTVYLGYLFIDSAVTIQKLTYGQQSFSALLGVFVMVPVVFLIVHRISQHLNNAA